MTHRLLISTFYNDLPNFKICVNLLNKYWEGNKALTVIYSLMLPNGALLDKNEIVTFLEKTLSENLLDWDYVIKPALKTKMKSGWEEQQLSKLFYSQEHNEDYTVIFDSKDFIHSKMYFEDFFRNSKMKVIPLDQGCYKFIDRCRSLFDLSKNTFHPDPISPWVWENKVLKDLYKMITENFGDYLLWEYFPGSEYMNYYYFKTITLKQDSFLVLDNRNLNIFQHHRLRDLSLLHNNGKILRNVGISNEDVIEWQLSNIKMANFELISMCELNKYITNIS